MPLWGSGLAFQAKREAFVKSWRLQRGFSAYTFLTGKLHLNSALLKYVEWEDDGK